MSMFSDVFLAMTLPEIKENLPNRMAYMALHFSPYDTGLSNIPGFLPQGCILLLDDSMPADMHNREVVAQQLKVLVDQFSPAAVLLDFQREASPESETMVDSILQALPCPVGATEQYASKFGCPVFLSPLPVNKPIEEHLTPWLQQGVFLELATESIATTVTRDGSRTSAIPYTDSFPLEDQKLCCHYDVEVQKGEAIFRLTRTKKDLAVLAEQAYRMGVKGVVGLYWELHMP